MGSSGDGELRRSGVQEMGSLEDDEFMRWGAQEMRVYKMGCSGDGWLTSAVNIAKLQSALYWAE